MLLSDAVTLLAGLDFVNYAHDRGNGDLLISHAGTQKCADEQGWTFAEVSAVAALLGCADIDIAAVVASDGDDLPMQRWRDGCDTCGHGDTLIVRGVLGQGRLDHERTALLRLLTVLVGPTVET